MFMLFLPLTGYSNVIRFFVLLAKNKTTVINKPVKHYYFSAVLCFFYESSLYKSSEQKKCRYISDSVK